mmetsp:Transcript_13500/g.23876  ORF Transcript_13500/g.23876 Transcript_13500/m.23876 type:complete len:210 (+) Transcript_13500:171-800(+)
MEKVFIKVNFKLMNLILLPLINLPRKEYRHLFREPVPIEMNLKNIILNLVMATFLPQSLRLPVLLMRQACTRKAIRHILSTLKCLHRKRYNIIPLQPPFPAKVVTGRILRSILLNAAPLPKPLFLRPLLLRARAATGRIFNDRSSHRRSALHRRRLVPLAHPSPAKAVTGRISRPTPFLRRFLTCRNTIQIPGPSWIRPKTKTATARGR